jgi:hypothetical protein
MVFDGTSPGEHSGEPVPSGPKGDVPEEEKEEAKVPAPGDRAVAQFSVGSLYAITNQYGVTKPFIEDPKVGAFTSGKAVPEALRTARHPVQDFFVYDGAHATIGAQGKVHTSRDQLLPNRRITEQSAVEWNRVGSKKGWMFNGAPQQQGPGGTGENFPTHTSDGFINSIKKNRWFPVPRSAENQGRATRDLPAIDIENNARGIGVTGSGSGNGGMQGGYKEINPRRLAALPVPREKYNWTGTRLVATGREDQGAGAGAGGYRAGYASTYPDRPSFPERRTTGLSRVTQNAA